MPLTTEETSVSHQTSGETANRMSPQTPLANPLDSQDPKTGNLTDSRGWISQNSHQSRLSDSKPMDHSDSRRSSETVPRSHRARLQNRPTAYVDVFVDDFCGEGQNSQMNPLKNQRRTLFHNMD
jgi:hypothetical protein